MPKLSNFITGLPCTSNGCDAKQVAKGLCNAHYQRAYRQAKQPGAQRCQRCGNPISRFSRPETKTCWNCRAVMPRACQDCGVLLTHRRKEVKRCWDCWSKFRNPYGLTCTHPGCVRTHFAKGLCAMHYLSQRDKTHRIGRGRTAKAWIATHPCQVCGYDRLPSEVARVTPGSTGGKYEIGNMIALCALHHRELDAGLREPPPALSHETSSYQ